MAGRSYRGALWGLALFGLVLDQVTKYTVFAWLAGPAHFIPGEAQGRCEVIPGVFRLLAQYTPSNPPVREPLEALAELPAKVNQGALFGLGQDYGHLANAIFAVVSVAAAVAIFYWSRRRTTAEDPYLCTALGLILAGTLGNLYDRIAFDGVRDFLHFYWINWPVFNVADCCLVCGAFLLLAQAFWSQPAATPAATPATRSTLPQEIAQAG